MRGVTSLGLGENIRQAAPAGQAPPAAIGGAASPWASGRAKGVGEGDANQMIIAQEKGACELKTSTKTSPHSEATVPAATHSVNITWLLKQLGGNGGAIDSPNFSIDRDKSTCATPRRNEDVTAALEHFNRVSDWGDDIASYLKHNLFNVPQRSAERPLSMGAIEDTDSIFVPVLPLLEVEAEAAGDIAQIGRAHV